MDIVGYWVDVDYRGRGVGESFVDLKFDPTLIVESTIIIRNSYEFELSFYFFAFYAFYAFHSMEFILYITSNLILVYLITSYLILNILNYTFFSTYATPRFYGFYSIDMILSCLYILLYAFYSLHFS